VLAFSWARAKEKAKATAEKAAAAQDRKRTADAEGESPRPKEVKEAKFGGEAKPKAKRVQVDDDDDDARAKPAKLPKLEPKAEEAPSPPKAPDPALVASACECVKRLGSDDAGEAATALAELEAMPMTLGLLGASGAGKAVNKIKKGESALAPQAKKLVDRWKSLAS